MNLRLELGKAHVHCLRGRERPRKFFREMDLASKRMFGRFVRVIRLEFHAKRCVSRFILADNYNRHL